MKGKLTVPLHYLEAWSVVNGTVTPKGNINDYIAQGQQSDLFPPGITGRPAEFGLALNDWWAKPKVGDKFNSGNNEGSVKMEGWAYFIDGVAWNDVIGNKGGPDWFWNQGDVKPNASPSGNLPWALPGAIGNTCWKKIRSGTKFGPANYSIGVYRKLKAEWRHPKKGEPSTKTTVTVAATPIIGGFPFNTAPKDIHDLWIVISAMR